MTREEAIEELERLLRHWDLIDEGIYDLSEHDQDAVEIALSALRPVSREQVEKVRGEWKMNSNWPDTIICAKCCHRFDVWKHESKDFHFCPYCGCAMTDEAVQMVMERLEALNDAVSTTT